MGAHQERNVVGSQKANQSNATEKTDVLSLVTLHIPSSHQEQGGVRKETFLGSDCVEPRVDGGWWRREWEAGEGEVSRGHAFEEVRLGNKGESRQPLV